MATIINERKEGNNFLEAGVDGDGKKIFRAPNPQEAVAVNYTALDGESYIEGAKDHKMILVFKGAGTLKIKGGNSYAGMGAKGDLDITSTATPKFMSIDSARFADKHTGRIKLEGSGVSVAVLEVR